jgi:streptogramin lyase
MSYSTIYDMRTGHVLTDGVQSQKVCDATINTARRIAREERRSVIVEDRGTEKCYRVTPAGHTWRLPKSWRDSKPAWEQDDA